MLLKRVVLLLLVGLICLSCKEEVLPKPKAMLRLDYENPRSASYSTDIFEFNINQLASVERTNENSITINYPSMNGSIFMTYKEVDDNLEQLLTDAQKLSYEHVIKADNIVEQPFVNNEERVFGMYYEVTGDAASQAQFYVTDSINHFVTGSLYFYAKPNYDSIYPAAIYLQKDIRQIMETLKWE